MAGNNFGLGFSILFFGGGHTFYRFSIFVLFLVWLCSSLVFLVRLSSYFWIV